MSTATVLDSTGASFVISNTMLDSTGASFDVGNDMLDSTGAAFQVFASVVDDDTGGSNVPYGLSLTKELRRDEEIVMQFVREYMKRVH